jgi:hypothetical protein
MICGILFYSYSNVFMRQGKNVTSHALLCKIINFHNYLANICENPLREWCCEMSFWVYYKSLLHDLLPFGAYSLSCGVTLVYFLYMKYVLFYS